MQYNCVCCNYSTEDRRNWVRHNKTKIHLKKIRNETHIDKNEIILRCQCNKEFTTKQGLSYHKKKCCKIDDKTVSIKNEKDVLITSEKDELIDQLKKEIEHLRLLAENAQDNTSKIATAMAKAVFGPSVNNYTYINITYHNAPRIKKMTDFSPIKERCIKERPNKKSIAEILIILYLHGELIETLGQEIVKLYKTDKPEEQSVWNTDIDRLNYIIRDIVGDKLGWIVDKKGVLLKEYIISPLVQYIKNEIDQFWPSGQYAAAMAANRTEITDAYAKLSNVKSSVLCNELLKYLAPHFQLSRIKEITNNSTE